MEALADYHIQIYYRPGEASGTRSRGGVPDTCVVSASVSNFHFPRFLIALGILKVPKKDRSSGAAIMRILVQVLRRVSRLYELQTKHSILQSRYSPQNVNRIDQCTARLS